jgi:hypothetical protein
MYVQRKSEARSRNHFCRGKAINITYSECVSSLNHPACKAHAPYYIVICGLSGSTVFFPHDLINGTIFGKKVIENKMCVLIFCTIFFWKISNSKRIYIGLHVKYSIFLSDLNETSIISTDLGKFWNIKFCENLSSGSRVVPCGRTDGQTWRS